MPVPPFPTASDKLATAMQTVRDLVTECHLAEPCLARQLIALNVTLGEILEEIAPPARLPVAEVIPFARRGDPDWRGNRGADTEPEQPA